jgi:hypothetical protein
MGKAQGDTMLSIIKFVQSLDKDLALDDILDMYVNKASSNRRKSISKPTPGKV